MEFLWVVCLYSFPVNFLKGYMIFKQVKEVKVKLSPELLYSLKGHVLFFFISNAEHTASSRFVFL